MEANMQPKEKDFEFPRGDTCPLSWTLTDYFKNELDTSTAELYFTFKNNRNVTNYIFQKKKSTGDITVNGKDCSLVIEHNDTAELGYATYFYDICIKSGSYVKTLAIGYITLTDEATFKANE